MGKDEHQCQEMMDLLPVLQHLLELEFELSPMASGHKLGPLQCDVFWLYSGSV